GVGVPELSGIFGAFAFGFSYTNWAWGVVSKFYTLNAFIVSCIIMLLIRWRKARIEEGDKGGSHSLSYLYVIAFICGIAGVVHISQFVLFPVYFLFIALVDWRVFCDAPKENITAASLLAGLNLRTFIIAAFFFLFGHSIIMHLPLRASQDPLINWGVATDWASFKWVYNREGYPTVGGARSLPLLWAQLQSFDVVREFTWAAVPVILLGIWAHIKNDWRTGVTLVFGCMFMTLVIVVMGNPVMENIFLLEQFYIPVYIMLCVLMGGAVWLVLTTKFAGPLAIGLTIPLILLGGVPMGFIKKSLGYHASAERMFFAGISYPPALYFVFILVAAGMITYAGWYLFNRAGKTAKAAYLVLFILLMVLFPVNELKANYWKNDRSANFIAYDMGNAELTFSPEFAVLFTWGDSGAFPMWYLQDVEQKRPDVLLVHTPHLPLDWFLKSLRRSPDEAGGKSAMADYKKLRDYNGIKGIEQLLSVPEDYRDPAEFISQIASMNPERPMTFDYSSRYSVNMPSEVFPYGITYRKLDKARYVEDNLRIWRYLVTRGLPEPTISEDLDEQKAVTIYGYIRQDLGKKYIDMGYANLAEEHFVEAVKYAPELWSTLETYMK
ncbi:MAG TPA: DUF2723 domain-containing protein, partial [Nitrospirota bacterium]